MVIFERLHARQTLFQAFDLGRWEKQCVADARCLVVGVQRRVLQQLRFHAFGAMQAAKIVAKRQLAALDLHVRTCDLSVGEEVMVDTDDGSMQPGLIIKLPLDKEDKAKVSSFQKHSRQSP